MNTHTFYGHSQLNLIRHVEGWTLLLKHWSLIMVLLMFQVGRV